MVSNKAMIIGLTGNSGSGKSCVAEIMRSEYGAYIIDADKIAHEVLLKTGRAYAGVVVEFGEGILNTDGEIDRRKLGAIIFENQYERSRLEQITHKHILAEMLDQAKHAENTHNYVVMDAPLLIEAGLHKESDSVWVVYAPPEVRLARIINRNGLSEAEVRSRIISQTAFDELKKHADVVIDNSGGLKELREAVERAIIDIIE